MFESLLRIRTRSTTQRKQAQSNIKDKDCVFKKQSNRMDVISFFTAEMLMRMVTDTVRTEMLRFKK